MHGKRMLVLSCLLLHLLVRDTSAGPVYEIVEDDVAAVGSFIREVRQPRPLRVATEVEDLTSADNAPESRQDTKKRSKNASGNRLRNASDVLSSVTSADNNAVLGKSDEGGYYRTYGSDAEGEKGYLKETYGKGDQGYKTLDTFHKQDGDKYEFEAQTTYGKGLANERKRHEGRKSRDHESAGTNVDSDYVGGEGDHDEGNEYSHYTGSDDGDDHYSGAYSNQYAEKKPESTSYGHSENYSSGGDDEGSYETHSSYNSDGQGEEEEDRY